MVRKEPAASLLAFEIVVGVGVTNQIKQMKITKVTPAMENNDYGDKYEVMFTEVFCVRGARASVGGKYELTVATGDVVEAIDKYILTNKNNEH